MDYEKKYKEALGIAKGILETRCIKGTSGAFHRKDLEEMFPELAESEDEKVVKYIIKVVHEWWERCNDPSPDFPNEKKMLAYLEKQGEQKPAWSEEKLFEWIRTNIRNYVNGEYNEFHHTVEYDGSINIDKLIKDMKDWLKSLRPPYYCDTCKLKKSVTGWKPTEEQMEALDEYVSSLERLHNISNGGYSKYGIMKSLLKDLKAL